MLSNVHLEKGVCTTFQEPQKSITGAKRGYWEKSISAASPSSSDDEKNNKGLLKFLYYVAVPFIVLFSLIFLFERICPPAATDEKYYYPKDFVKKANKENGPWRWQDFPRH
jgi:hypothetical protein